MKRIIAAASLAAVLASALPTLAQQPAAPARAGAAAAPAAPFAANIEAFRQADRANFPEPCQILLVGSSSIARWTTSAQDLAPMKSINRGFGGSTAPDANYYFGSIVAPYRPRQIVWYEGDNDINAGRTPDQVVAEFNKFLDLKDRALGTTPVYIIAIKPSRSRESQLAVQAEANAKLKAIADARKDVIYIDVVTPLMENGRPKDVFVADQLHLNPDGYKIWTAAIKPVLAKRPPTKAPGCS
ncbi:MAG: GDSL-type esterase/lipase family protein [Alphaproteobacteria bacterium]